MKPEFLVSKKGTVVITASQLWEMMGGKEDRFESVVSGWLSDVYEFDEVIRKPIRNTDFGLRKSVGGEGYVEGDYYLTLSFAKQIVLRSNHKNKLALAKCIKAKEVKSGLRKNFSSEEIIEIVHLSKAMTDESFQLKSEERHFNFYKSRKGNTTYWWKYRSEILGITVGRIKKWMEKRGAIVNGKSRREIIKFHDGYELVRIGVIDYLIAQGKHWHYARQAGDLAKLFIKEMEVSSTPPMDGFPEINRKSQLLLWN